MLSWGAEQKKVFDFQDCCWLCVWFLSEHLSQSELLPAHFLLLSSSMVMREHSAAGWLNKWSVQKTSGNSDKCHKSVYCISLKSYESIIQTFADELKSKRNSWQTLPGLSQLVHEPEQRGHRVVVVAWRSALLQVGLPAVPLAAPHVLITSGRVRQLPEKQETQILFCGSERSKIW